MLSRVGVHHRFVREYYARCGIKSCMGGCWAGCVNQLWLDFCCAGWKGVT